MTNRTATESEVRSERASSYLDGAGMGMAHLIDGLAAGKSVDEALDYAKAMIDAAAQNLRDNAALSARNDTRLRIRAEHSMIDGFGAARRLWTGRKLA